MLISNFPSVALLPTAITDRLLFKLLLSVSSFIRKEASVHLCFATQHNDRQEANEKHSPSTPTHEAEKHDKT